MRAGNIGSTPPRWAVLTSQWPVHGVWFTSSTWPPTQRALDDPPRPRLVVLNHADLERLAALLPAIAGVWGSEWFRVSEVKATAAVQLVAGDVSPSEVGQLLRRAVGHDVGGWTVERGGQERDRVLWRVLATMAR